MNEITMIPIEQLEHHPENPRLDLGDLTELTDSIRANGILQNLTVVFQPAHDMSTKEWITLCEQYNRKPTEALRQLINSKRIPDRYLVVIGNRRLEASRIAGLTELPCVVSEMSHEEQIATMLQENMQRSDLTVYEQAKGIQMMIDLGFSKEQVSERTGFSKPTIERRLAVATLPEKETKNAVAMGYDLLDLVEIAKIDDREKQAELLKNENWQDPKEFNPSQLRQRIARVKQEVERENEKKRLLPEVQEFAKPMSEKDSNSRFGNGWDHLRTYDVELKPGSKVKAPKDEGKYYYYISWGTIEIWQKATREKRVKSEAEIALEKKQHDAKELNDRMRENRVAFISGFTPNKTQETKLKAKLLEYLFGWKSKYTAGDFFTSYHSWNIGMFRKFCGMSLEEGRGMEESLADEMKRRGIPMGRAILAWMLCGGMKSDDRQGYASQYNGNYQPDKDMDDVYTILTDAGYVLTEEEQKWKDGTHEFYQREDS